MFSLPIVKHFKVFKHRLPCFCSCLIGLLLDTLLLYCSKERFHESIIIAITSSTHADFYSILFEQSLITRAGILASPVRMMQQTSSWLSSLHCHYCCNRLPIWYLAHQP